MDTQNLKAFQAVAELGSFSGAAERLFLTQPAVSKRIASLEQQLNCRLFDRIGRSVTLTEAGLALLPRAKQILLDVDDTQRLISDLSGEVGGRLSLATSHHIGLHRLPSTLREYAKRYPGVSLELEFLDSEKAYDEVQHGNFDLAVITLALQGEREQDREQDQKIQSHALWRDDLSFVVSPDHPLTRQQNLSLQDLSPYTAILPDLNTYTTRLIKGMFDQQGVDLEITMATNHLDTIKMMVSIGLGWAVIPNTLIDDQLTTLSVDNLSVSRQLGCIYHRERTLSNAATAFLKLLLQTKEKDS